MLKVTERALAYFARMLDDRTLPLETVVRCTLDDASMSLMPDTRQEGDVVYRHGDRPVLVMDAMLSEELDGHAFDVASSDDGESLTLR